MTKRPPAREAPAPPVQLQVVHGERAMHALCVVRKGLLHATHYAGVISGAGSGCVWGVFSVQTGRLLACYGTRSQVEAAYPNKAWRRKAGTFKLTWVGDASDQAARADAVRRQVGKQARADPPHGVQDDTLDGGAGMNARPIQRAPVH